MKYPTCTCTCTCTCNPKRIASMTYDAGHSLLLMGATDDGLWRMVTK
ncbi:hypothetical protein [Rhizobacter sp. P5_C2]